MAQKVLLIQPEVTLREALLARVQQSYPEAEVYVAAELAEIELYYREVPPVDLLITEVYIEGLDGLGLLRNFRERYPSTAVMIATVYDLSEYSSHLQGMALVSLPLHEGLVKAVLDEALSSLRGEVYPPYLIGEKVGSDAWGQTYQATHQGVKRQVLLTILRPDTTPEQIQQFKALAAYQARAAHPNVTAVYEAGELNGRYYYAKELWAARSLEERVKVHETLEPRQVARIISVVTQVLLFWLKEKYAHEILGPGDVTMTNNNVVKIRNRVDPQATPPQSAGQWLLLAQTLQQLLPVEGTLPAKLVNLLQHLSQPEINLPKIGSEAQVLETELAPEQQVRVSQEHVIAQREIASAQKKQKTFLYAGIGGLAALLLALGTFFYFKLLYIPSARVEERMVRVPEGSFVYQTGQTETTKQFYIDRYEVTIAQYIKFLRAVRNAKPGEFAHPSQKNLDMNYAPYDWVRVIQSIRDGKPYNGQQLTVDCPVFNINWYQAYAYAKWAGKRLPTEVEWEKAARGLQGNKFPWGNEPQPTYANTGLDYFSGRTEQSGKIDGFYGVCDVDKKGKDDSDFKVIGLGGNVSEWTDTAAPSSKLQSIEVRVVRGGNFKSKKTELTERIRTEPPESTQPWLGFRCVSDTPPK